MASVIALHMLHRDAIDETFMPLVQKQYDVLTRLAEEDFCRRLGKLSFRSSESAGDSRRRIWLRTVCGAGFTKNAVSAEGD
jgi:hypothetical protein